MEMQHLLVHLPTSSYVVSYKEVLPVDEPLRELVRALCNNYSNCFSLHEGVELTLTILRMKE